jgi:hypothetical protein
MLLYICFKKIRKKEKIGVKMFAGITKILKKEKIGVKMAAGIKKHINAKHVDENSFI